VKERDVERALVQHLKKFMLELGRGFAYVGNQYNIKVDDDEFFLDLLFYNIQLKCYVVFELKVGDFKPEFAGKLNFYTNTVNAKIKGIDDKPTIGVLLCKTPNETVVRYSLLGVENPIGVAEYRLSSALPKQFRDELPTVEELEQEIESEYTELRRPVDKKIGHLKELIKGLKQSPVKERRNVANCARILDEVVFPLRGGIQTKLNENGLSEHFESVELLFWTENQGHKTDEALRDYLKLNKEVGDFTIDLRLKGFKPAGIKAFDIWGNVVISTSTYNYTLYLDGNRQNIIMEKLYHEILGKSEIEQVVNIFLERVVDSITNQLELLNNPID
jgi:hypothetical protein